MGNSVTYFDAVLDPNYMPVFNDTPAAVKDWLEANKDDPLLKDCMVCLGTTLTTTSIENYLKN